MGRLSVGTLAVLAFCGLLLAGAIAPALGVEAGPPARSGPAEPLPTEPGAVGDWFERSFDAVDRVRFDVDRETGIDVAVSVGETDAGVTALGHGDDGRAGSGRIAHGAIDEGVDRSATTGLCAVGLLDDDAPASVEVDGNNSTVRASFDGEPADGGDGDRERIDPMEIAERCGAGYDSAQ